MPTLVDIAEALDRRKLGAFEIKLICVSSLVTFFDSFDMNVIAFTSKPLAHTFHLTPQMLGDVFSIGILGILIGNFLLGYLGDRLGRRSAIIIAVGSFSVLTLALAFARSYQELLIIRFMDGVALGGALPVIWALNTEYAPKRLRARIITIIMLGYGFGGVAAGPIARAVLPRFDWPGVFVVGAALSFIVTLLLIPALPESIRFLIAKDGRFSEVERLLHRMKIALPHGTVEQPLRVVLGEESAKPSAPFRIARLFEGKLKWQTPLLWLSYFASSISTFFLASWGPLILENMGFSADNAAYLTSLNALCAMTGGLVLMRFTDRHGPISISILPLIAAPLLLIAGLAPTTLTGFLLMLIPISLFLGGGHYGITSIIAGFYPSDIRSNGTGWCSGVAKIGSVIGPFVGGWVLASSLPVRMTYALLAVCPAIYGLAILSVGLIGRPAFGVRDAAVLPSMAEGQPRLGHAGTSAETQS
jgi:MFS transporter, AAHS family, 4-hydroxybenzoate transporter